MSLSTTTVRVSYAGDGVTVAFSFPYIFFASADLKVYLVTNNIAVLQSTGYTVSGGSGSTGTVTFTSAPSASQTVRICRDPALTQEQDFDAEADPLPVLTAYADLVETKLQALRSQGLRASAGAPVGFDGEIEHTGEAGLALVSTATGFELVDASSASGETVTATGSTTARTLSSRFAEILNVKDFGAIGDGVTDDTSAVNAAFTQLRALVDESSITAYSYFVYFPPGSYRVTSSVNATSLRNRKWGIIGPGQILGDFTSAYPILDLSDSRWGGLRDLFVMGASGKTPGTGILFARKSGGDVSDVFFLENVVVYGTFSVACLYNYGSEDMTGLHVQCVNLSSSASTYCAVFDGTNSLSVTSPFNTIAANTAVSMNDTQIQALDCRKTAGGPAIFVRRTAGLDLDNSYAVSVNDAAIVVSCDSFGHQNLRLDVHCETTGLTTCVRFDGVSPQTIKGFTFHDYAPQASSEIFKAGTSVTSIILRDVDIHIASFGVNPSSNVFNDPSYFTLHGGRIYVGDATYFTAASLAAFWSMEGTTPTSGRRSVYRTDSATSSQHFIEQGSTGDATAQFLLTGVRAWNYGIDNSDSDSFKIAPADNAFASSVFALTTGGDAYHTQAANGAGTAVKHVTTLLSAVSGATVTATNLIPAGSYVLSCTTRVTTALGGGGGTTGYQVGDGSDADRWGVASTITSGTQTGMASAGAPTASPVGYFVSANNVVITAVGGNFNGTGAIRVCVAYVDGVSPTS